MILYLNIFLSGVLVVLAGMVAYLILLTLAAWRASPRTSQPQGAEIDRAAKQRFAFLIPAHNEERGIGECLASLSRLDYPTSQYQVLVIADNCHDRTASIASDFGVLVTERNNEDQRGKGYALEWGLQHLQSSPERFDAVIILDADTSVSQNFLRVMSTRLARGERVIQPYYSVRNANRSWNESLRYVALTVLHYLRPQGRMILGGSAGLKGNGMLFATDILRRHHWSDSITEDIEFHMALLLDGERVTFAPDAVVWGEMPDSLAKARSQVDRWEQGRIEMARRYIPHLLRAAGSALRRRQIRRAYLLLDAVMEHIIPPFTILFGLSTLGLAAAVGLLVGTRLFESGPLSIGTQFMTSLNLALGLLLFAGQFFYLFSGLKLAGAPPSAYQALYRAPIFIVWKLGQYLRVLMRRERIGWVRTARNRG